MVPWMGLLNFAATPCISAGEMPISLESSSGLIKTIVTAGTAELTVVCTWQSNLDGTGSTGVVRPTKACAQDLTAGAFYHILVHLNGGPVACGLPLFVGRAGALPGQGPY
jgi:hypothetical protein